MRSEGDDKGEEFRSGGRTVGVLGLVAVVAVLVYSAFLAEFHLATWPAALLAAVVVWSVLIRPAVVLREHEVELRNVVHTVSVPYARIRDVEVNQMTRLHVDERTYVAGSFGRSRGEIRRDARAPSDARLDQHSLGWLVQERISRRAADARRTVGDSAAELPVRRSWARVELTLLVVLAVATVVALVV